MVVQGILSVLIVVAILLVTGVIAMLLKCFRKVDQGQALVRNGLGGTRVSFSGIVVIPVLHKLEIIDISIKRVSIDRHGSEGLICKDNMRADIKVAFFVRVNKTEEDVLKVAQSIGCERASSRDELQQLFEAKFSEALKTVGKQFEFVDLYNSREQFKEEILKIIGTDLNGFVLDDAAIDYLEQTGLDKLNPDNILDAEGIKKITTLTAEQKIRANKIQREKEKTITQQDVEAKEAVLEMNRQLADSENKQKREIETIKAREEAETQKVQQEERLKAEKARILTEEEINIAEENKNRQIIVAQKNKERTSVIETERVEKDRMLETTERERIVALANIEKDKAIEGEKKAIQDVIRERVMVEKTVIEEKERIKDTESLATAEREKKVALIQTEKEAEQALLREVKSAEAQKQAAELKAQESIIAAEAFKTATEKKAEAKKMMADAEMAEKAAPGLAEVKVSQSQVEVIEKKGSAEARVMEMKYEVDARGIEQKANAMKRLDEVGRAHEEFKLTLEKNKTLGMAAIQTQMEIGKYQSDILAQALKTAKVDIVGGETLFFENIIKAISNGKSIDRYIQSSEVMSDIKETFFNSDPDYFRSQLSRFFKQFNVSPDEFKNLTIAAAMTKLIALTENSEEKGRLYELLSIAERSGVAEKALTLKPDKSAAADAQ